jgi:hypothetical protein
MPYLPDMVRRGAPSMVLVELMTRHFYFSANPTGTSSAVSGTQTIPANMTGRFLLRNQLNALLSPGDSIQLTPSSGIKIGYR